VQFRFCPDIEISQMMALSGSLWIQIKLPHKEQYSDPITAEPTEAVGTGFDVLYGAIQPFRHGVRRAMAQVSGQAG